jgi:hypothetical protein
MANDWTTRPEAGEFAPYYSRYIDRVPDGSLLDLLEEQLPAMLDLLDGVDEDRAGYRYEPGKWSIREVIGHLADAERIFAYRALRIARQDRTPLASFEENDYVANGNFEARSLLSLVDEWATVRRSTQALFEGLDPACGTEMGTASENPVSVRALGYILHGHVDHHLAILRERYGVA